jgi:hypothetical protein
MKKKLLSYLFLLPQISQHCKLFHFFNVEEKNLANFKKIIELFTQKIAQTSQKYGLGIWDPENT